MTVLILAVRGIITMPKYVITLSPTANVFFVGFCPPLYADLATWCPDLKRATPAPTFELAVMQRDQLRRAGFDQAEVRTVE